ncbi:MAG: type IV secretion protein IcmD [Candidatus Berkiella sp.]
MNTTMVKSSQPNQAMWTMLAYFCALISLFLICDLAFAEAAAGGDAPSGSIGEAAKTITGSMTGIAKLITATSYVAGVGFALMGMLKLKAHKDNPTQVPLSQPIVLLAIAAGLVFLPSLITTAGKTVWSNPEAADSTGTGGEGLGGSSSSGSP